MGHRREKRILRGGHRAIMTEARKHAVDEYRREHPAFVSKKGSKNKGKGYVNA